jgi:hypothetical protein
MARPNTFIAAVYGTFVIGKRDKDRGCAQVSISIKGDEFISDLWLTKKLAGTAPS